VCVLAALVLLLLLLGPMPLTRCYYCRYTDSMAREPGRFDTALLTVVVAAVAAAGAYLHAALCDPGFIATSPTPLVFPPEHVDDPLWLVCNSCNVRARYQAPAFGSAFSSVAYPRLSCACCACSHTVDRAAAAVQALPLVQPLRAQVRPPLPVRQQLHRAQQRPLVLCAAAAAPARGLGVAVVVVGRYVPSARRRSLDSLTLSRCCCTELRAEPFDSEFLLWGDRFYYALLVTVVIVWWAFACVSLALLSAYRIAYNITTNEVQNHKRYQYIDLKRGHYHNRFDKGLVRNCLTFWRCDKREDLEVLPPTFSELLASGSAVTPLSDAAAAAATATDAILIV